MVSKVWNRFIKFHFFCCKILIHCSWLSCSILNGFYKLDGLLWRCVTLYHMQHSSCCKFPTSVWCRTPETYANLKLPHKLPPKKEPLSVTGLPMLGYMEQTVALAVTKAMTRCGCFKPKYPFLTTTQSALIYIAYHLKGMWFHFLQISYS